MESESTANINILTLFHLSLAALSTRDLQAPHQHVTVFLSAAVRKLQIQNLGIVGGGFKYPFASAMLI